MTDRLESVLRSELREQTAPIRADEDFLAEAIDRGYRARRRRRRATWLSAAAAALAIAVAASVVGVRNDDGGVGPQRTPTTPSPSPRGDTGPAVLGSTVLDDGRRVEFLGSRRAGGCLRVTGIDDKRRACAYVPSMREPPLTAPIAAEVTAQRGPAAPFEVYGPISVRVAEVVIRYRSGGRVRRMAAELVWMTDEEALRAAGIEEPFGYFLAELPAATTADDVEAVGFDASGDRLGSASFAMFADLPPCAFVEGPWSDAELERSKRWCTGRADGR
jgi:hypothetical protein